MSHTIYILSGGSGTSGDQLVNTVLAQFPESGVQVIVVPHIRETSQFENVVAQAQLAGATVIHTMVDSNLRAELHQSCLRAGVFEIDLMGDLFERLIDQTAETPLGQPGLYRQLRKDYFERVAAMEFAMAHDDGKDPEKWPQADLLLIGVSRVGKTPLCLYLSVMGWKAANTPWIPGIPLPDAFARLDPGRVIGLTIEPGQLVSMRQERQRRLGIGAVGSYSDPETIFSEVHSARTYFRRHGYTVIDVTDKPLESTADEVIRLMVGRFGTKARVG